MATTSWWNTNTRTFHRCSLIRNKERAASTNLGGSGSECAERDDVTRGTMFAWCNVVREREKKKKKKQENSLKYLMQVGLDGEIELLYQDSLRENRIYHNELRYSLYIYIKLMHVPVWINCLYIRNASFNPLQWNRQSILTYSC